MVDSFVEKILDCLTKETKNTVPEFPKQVLRYGIKCFVSLSIPFFVLLVSGATLHKTIEILSWMLSFLLLRSFVGGYHAKTNERCIILSILIGMGTFYIPIAPLYSPLEHIVVYGLCLLLIIFFAPIPNPQKKLSLHRMKIYKIRALLVLFIILAISCIVPQEIKNAFLYAIIYVNILAIPAIIQTASWNIP